MTADVLIAFLDYSVGVRAERHRGAPWAKMYNGMSAGSYTRRCIYPQFSIAIKCRWSLLQSSNVSPPEFELFFSHFRLTSANPKIKILKRGPRKKMWRELSTTPTLINVGVLATLRMMRTQWHIIYPIVNLSY